MRVMLKIIVERPTQTLLKTHLRLPTQRVLDFGKIAVIITDVDVLAFWRERHDVVAATRMHVAQLRRKIFQIDDFTAAEIEDLAIGIFTDRSEQQGIDHIVYIIEIPQLQAIAKNENRLAFHQVAHPDPQEGLPRI